MEKQIDRIFTEIGIGNDTFINTEVEYTDGTEDRRPGFYNMKLNDVYLRLWWGEATYIASFEKGFFKKPKTGRKKFKLLLGFGGLERQ